MTENSVVTVSTFRVTKCEYCKAPIIWAEMAPNPRARTKKNDHQPVPMDADPDPVGAYTMMSNPGGRPLVGVFETRAKADAWRAAGQPTYQRHSRTCPQLERWRPGQSRSRSKG